MATTYVSLRILLDCLARCWTVMSVFTMGGGEMSEDEDSETRNELHGGQTLATTTVAAMSRNARAPDTQQ